MNFDPTQGRTQKKLHRISMSDSELGLTLLTLAIATLEFEERTQRQLFRRHMPMLYFLNRHEGVTFKQLTSLLADCGMKLCESTVRAYFSKLVNVNEAEYIKYAADRVPVWNRLKQELTGVDITRIASTAERVLEESGLSE